MLEVHNHLTLVDITQLLDYAFVAASSWDIPDGIINSLTSEVRNYHVNTGYLSVHCFGKWNV